MKDYFEHPEEVQEILDSRDHDLDGYEEQEEHIENGYYQNQNGYGIFIIWSYIEQ